MNNSTKNASPLLAKIEADKGMIAEALSLYFHRFREEEIVLLAPDLNKDPKNPRASLPSVCFYGDWLSTQDKIEEAADHLANYSNSFHASGRSLKPICFCPNPIRGDYQKAHWCGSPNITSDDITMRHWLLFDLDRKDANKLPAPTESELNTLAQGRDYLTQLLASRGFDKGSWIVTDSGNGWHIDVPVAIENTEENEQLVKALYKDLGVIISANFSTISFDSTTDARRFWSLPGTHNLKYPEAPKLRLLCDYPTVEQVSAGVNQNTKAFFNVTLALMSAKAKEEKSPSKVSKLGSVDDGAMLRWEADTPWSDILEPLGCSLFSKGATRELWTRPGKETSQGASLIAGARHDGAGDTLFNLSSNLGVFPQNVNIKKYRAFLMANNILSASGSVLDEVKLKEFFHTVKKRYGQNSMEWIYQKQGDPAYLVNMPPALNARPIPASSTVPASPLPAPVAEGSVTEDEINYKSKPGTLDDIPLPGDLELMARDLNAGSPIDNMGLARSTALALFSFIVGKSVRDSTGKACNIYLINIGKSCSGKGSAGRYANMVLREMERVVNPPEEENAVFNNPGNLDFGAISVRGAKFGSFEGVHTQTVLHGRVLFVGDESEDFLLPGANEASKDARETTALLLSHSDGSTLPGRALASGFANPHVNWPFYVQLHATQPGIYWKRVQERHALKGILSRYLHISVGDGEPKRHPRMMDNISPEVASIVRYWGERNRKGLDINKYVAEKFFRSDTFEGYFLLGLFSPRYTSLAYPADLGELRYKYQIRCRKRANIAEENGDFISQQAYGRAHEHAQALAQLFTVAVNREARAITPEAWTLAQRITEKCIEEIITSCGQAGDLREASLRHKVLQILRSENMHIGKGKYICPRKDGIVRRDLLRKMQGGLKTEEELTMQLNTLAALEQIKIAKEEAGGKERFRIFLLEQE